MSNATHLPGKFVWFELATTDATRTQRFYAEVLGWKTVPFAMGPTHYDMIYVGDTMIGGYAAAPSGDQTPHWMSYVSVEDVDQAVTRAAALGGRVIVPPFDARGVGRRAKIADPQGAEVWLFTKQTSDPIDGESAPGTWCWNELHTPDPAAAVAFYEQVVGYSHRAIDMGPAGAYFILSQGGIDRAGVTAHQKPSVAPHWLPYVWVEDADAIAARAKKEGGTIQIGPEMIPDIGRFAVLSDPTGALLAVLNPLPTARGTR